MVWVKDNNLAIGDPNLKKQNRHKSIGFRVSPSNVGESQHFMRAGADV